MRLDRERRHKTRCIAMHGLPSHNTRVNTLTESSGSNIDREQSKLIKNKMHTTRPLLTPAISNKNAACGPRVRLSAMWVVGIDDLEHANNNRLRNFAIKKRKRTIVETPAAAMISIVDAACTGSGRSALWREMTPQEDCASGRGKRVRLDGDKCDGQTADDVSAMNKDDDWE
uniref:Uncharacterized protein n=1 Tax=Steinernema glaseri TaxID=37863 RepID=A0A1I7XYC6_9BILA